MTEKFNEETKFGILAGIALCLVAVAYVVKQVATGVSWYTENTRKVTQVVERTWWE
jgi:hypothetical protein